MKKKYKVLLIIILLLMLIAVGCFVYKQFFYKSSVSPETPPIQITNQIEEYGYTLEDRDSSLFKEKFETLKTLLNHEEYDKNEYITLISELFIIDLYTISNKISKYDVGGLEYVYKDASSSLKSVVQNSIYKNVENNIDGTRNQSLPEVSSISVSSVTDYTYTMPDKSKVDGYKVVLSWTYVESLGYDTEGTLLLIPDGKKYGVVYFNP